MPKSSNNSFQNSDYHKLNFNEFWQVINWAVRLMFKFQPLYSGMYLVTSTLRELTVLVNSYLMARIIDTLIKILNSPERTFAPLYPYFVIILFYNIFNSMVGFFRNYAQNNLRVRTRPQITQAIYSKMNDLGIQTLEQPEVNNQINRANLYIWNVFGYFQTAIATIAESVKLVGLVIAVVTAVPFLIPVIVLSLIPYFLQDKKYRALIYKYGFDYTEQSRNANTTSQDLSYPNKLQEISITQAFKFLDIKYMDFQDSYIKEWVKIIKRWFIGSRFYQFLSDLVILGGLVYIMQNAIKGLISIGNVTFYSQILSSLQSSIMNLIGNLNDLFENSLQLKDIYQLFNTKPVVPDGTTKLNRLEKGPEILFRNVSFAYPNTTKLVIDDVSFRIKPGEKLAIVGHNGAGKTTLVKLIMRVYQTTQGEILVNGQNVNDLAIESLYQNTGVLFQDYNVYPQLTVSENIYIGDTSEKLDPVRIRLAAQQADALDFIESYPKKFDQTLSEKYKGGIRPSTGQWQKIAIARFFYRNSPLVIFDEPTASIDPVSEYNIFNRIYEFFENKTVIIISHRFSTVRNADRIIVLDNGKIVEEGSHNHLMSINGKYANAFMLQAQGYTNDQ